MHAVPLLPQLREASSAKFVAKIPMIGWLGPELMRSSGDPPRACERTPVSREEGGGEREREGEGEGEGERERERELL